MGRGEEEHPDEHPGASEPLLVPSGSQDDGGHRRAWDGLALLLMLHQALELSTSWSSVMCYDS